MRRRDLLRHAVLGASGAALVAGCAGAPGAAPAVRTRTRLNWRLASSFPRSLDTIYGAAEVLAKRLESLSEGAFSVRCYPSGELVPPLQVLDAVQQGTVHIGHTASYYYTGKNAALAFDTAMPFGLTGRQQLAWLQQGGGLERMRELLADFGIRPFCGGNTGCQMGGWFRREVATLADLRGLRMRIPGLGGEVLSRLGVSVQTIPAGEIYPALERGVIDATEWVGPYDDEKLGFHQVAKFYYYPGWWEPGPSLSLYVNQKAWDTLPADYRSMFEAAAQEATLFMVNRYDAENPAALERLLAGGVQLRPFSGEILQAAHDLSFDLMAGEAAKDQRYARILEEWQGFRSRSYRWFATAENSFESFAYGPR